MYKLLIVAFTISAASAAWDTKVTMICVGFTITEIFHQLYACSNHSISHVGFGTNSYDKVQKLASYISHYNVFTVLVFVHFLVKATLLQYSILLCMHLHVFPTE